MWYPCGVHVVHCVDVHILLLFTEEPSPRKTNGNPPPIDDNREYPRPNAQEEIYNQVAKSKQTKKLDRRFLETAEPIGKPNQNKPRNFTDAF